MGSAYDEIDRAGDAMKQYQAALELNPDNYRANLLLGRMLALQDRPKEAMPLQQRAVKLEPQSADAHKFLGNVYTVLGEEEKARREEAEAQRLQSDGRAPEALGEFGFHPSASLCVQAAVGDVSGASLCKRAGRRSRPGGATTTRGAALGIQLSHPSGVFAEERGLVRHARVAPPFEAAPSGGERVVTGVSTIAARPRAACAL